MITISRERVALACATGLAMAALVASPVRWREGVPHRSEGGDDRDGEAIAPNCGGTHR